MSGAHDDKTPVDPDTPPREEVFSFEVEITAPDAKRVTPSPETPIEAASIPDPREWPQEKIFERQLALPGEEPIPPERGLPAVDNEPSPDEPLAPVALEAETAAPEARAAAEPDGAETSTPRQKHHRTRKRVVVKKPAKHGRWHGFGSKPGLDAAPPAPSSIVAGPAAPVSDPKPEPQETTAPAKQRPGWRKRPPVADVEPAVPAENVPLDQTSTPIHWEGGGPGPRVGWWRRLLNRLNQPVAVGKSKEGETPAAETPSVAPSDAPGAPAAEADQAITGATPSGLKALWQRLNRPVGASKEDAGEADHALAPADYEATKLSPEPSPKPARRPFSRRKEDREKAGEVSDTPLAPPPAPIAPPPPIAPIPTPTPVAPEVAEPVSPPAAPSQPSPAADVPEVQVLTLGEETNGGDEGQILSREQRRIERRRAQEEKRERKEARAAKKGAVRSRVRSFFSKQKEEQREVNQARRAKVSVHREKRLEKKAARAEAKAAKAAARKEKNNWLERRREQRRQRAAAKAREGGRDIVGLDIGASGLRAVHIREGEPLRIVEMPLEPGIILHGLLEEPDELTASLKKLWGQGELSSKKVNLSIANRLVTVRAVELAAADEELLEQALAMMAETVIAPMNPDESIIDYDELSRSGSKRSIQLAAADDAMVRKYVRAVEKAGLLAVSCEVAPLAAGRALVVPWSADSAHLVIDIGAEITTVRAASGPDIFFMRVIEIGGNVFTDAIRSALDVPFAEAERLKRAIGIDGPVSESGIDEASVSRVRAAMRPISDRLCQEIRQTRLYYEEQERDKEAARRDVSGYFLTGGGSRLAGLDAQIELFADLPKRSPLRPRPDLQSAGPELDRTATVLGLASGHTMSLLPDVASRSFSVRPFRRQAKISIEQAERQAKRLASKRGKRAGSDPRMIGVLVAVAALGGCFYFGGKIKSANEERSSTSALTEAAAAPSGPTVTYNDPKVQLMATALLTHPDYAALRPVPSLLAANGGTIQGVNANGTRVVFSVVFASESEAEALRASVENKITEAKAVTLQAPTAGTQAYALLIDVPHDPEVAK